jgi:DNA-binding CsgD family transcriptional regulator
MAREYKSTSVEKLQSAQLQVVLPGSSSSFRRRVIDAMCDLVSAPGAFCFLGKEDARAYGDSTRLVDGNAKPVGGPAGTRLSSAFGFDRKSVVMSPHRAYLSTDLWPEGERATLPYFQDCSGADGFVHALLLFLHEGGVLFGLAGIERRSDDGPFGDDHKQKLEGLAPFIVAGARAQLQYEELSREASALRALGKISGIVCVVDRDRKRVVWAADREHGIEWDEDVEPIEAQLVDAAERSLAARARKEELPTPPRLAIGTIVSVTKIDGDPVFGGARCAVVRVQGVQRPTAMEGLSKREREIARLLVAGYSGVNVAAIAGLSENTVRTYVRRLYTKLGANNRADLVRKLIVPEEAVSTSSSSQIAPTPDSSLAHGDDTLD